jgi:hypothetical protein
MNPVGTFRADLMNNGIFQYFSTRHIVDSADASEKVRTSFESGHPADLP